MRVFLLLAACGFAVATPQAANGHDLVFFGEKRPVVIRVNILIDGQPCDDAYRVAYENYLKALFAQLDRNADGFLDEAEGQRLPPPITVAGASGRSTNLAFNFRVVDTNSDGKIDVKEAAAYYRDYGSAGIGLTMAARVAPITGGVNDAIFAKLDVDKDGKLTRAELASAAALMEFDVDENELLTADEFGPRREVNPAMLRQPAAASLMPRPGRNDGTFALKSPGEAGEQLAKRLRARYGDDASAEPDLELLIQLGERGAGRARVTVTKVADKSLRVQATNDGAVIRVADSNVVIELNLNDGRPLPAARARQQIVDQFHAADIGRKGHVTPKDAGLRGFFPAQFALLDRDLNEKLTEKELIDYLDRMQELQYRAITSVVGLLGSESSLGLFDLLDNNRDGRLSGPELARSGPRLLALAGDKESIGRDDLPRVHRLGLGLCQASFNRAGGDGSFAPRGLPMLALDWAPPGQAWFHKMDRNNDGAISPREFLGPMATFRTLDADGDGLLAPDEASRRP